MQKCYVFLWILKFHIVLAYDNNPDRDSLDGHIPGSNQGTNSHLMGLPGPGAVQHHMINAPASPPFHKGPNAINKKNKKVFRPRFFTELYSSVS